VQLAKQGAMSYRTTALVTQSGTLVAQLVLALSRNSIHAAWSSFFVESIGTRVAGSSL
jgi:hypothetical protein